jgi:hypothetical protein
MKWFKKMVIKWVHDDWNNAKVGNSVAIPEIECASSHDIDFDNGFRFTVLPARGGTIVQLRSYNRKIDRNNESTHVIPEGESIAERIGQIVSLELLQGHPSDR